MFLCLQPSTVLHIRINYTTLMKRNCYKGLLHCIFGSIKLVWTMTLPTLYFNITNCNLLDIALLLQGAREAGIPMPAKPLSLSCEI